MLEIYAEYFSFTNFDDISQKHMKVVLSRGSNNGYDAKLLTYGIMVIFQENLLTIQPHKYVYNIVLHVLKHQI